MNTVKAYGYLRVSSKVQVDGDGLVRQEKAIRDYAKAHGIEVVRFYREEGVSGTVETRPSLAQMMVDLEENGHGIKTILIEKVDRLARDLMVQEAIINDLRKKGFNLISTMEGDDLLSGDPTRTLVRQVLGAIAQYEKQMIVLKLRAARERKKARTGKCGGRRSLAEVSPEALEQLRKLRRKPKGGRRKTYAEVAQELNRMGYRTASGVEFTASNVGTILGRL